MDYTKLPRQLIYRDRRSIEDFGVYGDHKINKIIAKALRSFPFISGRNAEKNALTCMNNAYYICTMALLEKDPAWRISDYETISKNVDNNSKDEMGLVTLSLVYLYLCSLPKGVGSHLRDFLEEFKKSINHTGYLDTMTEGLDEDVELSSNEFAPRKIDNAAIEDLRQPHWNWTQYTDYYKSNIMDEVLKSLCKNELECLNIIKSFQRDAEDFYGTNDRYYNEIYERIAYLKKVFCPNLYSEEESKLNNTSDDTSSSPCLNDPSPRIKELEAENLDLQQQLREAKTRIIELEKKIEANKNQLKISEELSQWYTDDNNYNKLTGEEIFTRREKIVFFATVLSLDINKKYTILHNLATFIAELCKGEDTDDIDNIGSFLSKMQNPKEKAANAKAAKRVSDLMQQLVPIKYRNDNTLAVNRFAESMKLNFPEEED